MDKLAWSLEEKVKLVDYLMEGLTSTEIAVKLKRTRNSISGQIDRMKLTTEQQARRNEARRLRHLPKLSLKKERAKFPKGAIVTTRFATIKSPQPKTTKDALRTMLAQAVRNTSKS